MYHFHVVLLALAGCPYVFGPADFSNVPAPTPPSTAETGLPAATGDTGPTPGTVPTGDTGPIVPTTGPTILEIAPYPVFDGLRLVMTVEPADNLDGGVVVLTDGARVEELSIPDEVNASTDNLLVATFPLQDPCAGIDADFDVAVRDAKGAQSPYVHVTYVIAGLGVVGDGKLVGAIDLGELAAPVLWCGGIEQVGESDRFDFRVREELDAEIVVTWDGTADLDLALKEPPITIDSSYTVIQPAFLHGTLEPGVDYQVQIQHFSGTPPERWLLALTLDPG